MPFIKLEDITIQTEGLKAVSYNPFYIELFYDSNEKPLNIRAVDTKKIYDQITELLRGK